MNLPGFYNEPPSFILQDFLYPPRNSEKEEKTKKVELGQN